METYTADVTQDIIDEARVRRTRPGYDVFADCPLAQAASIAANVNARCSAGMILWPDGQSATPLPTEALMWRDRWDTHHPVQPFSFEFARPAARGGETT